jgi:hypothetical protein
MKAFILMVLGMLLGGCASLSRYSQSVPALVVSAGEWTSCKADEAEFAVRVRYELKEISAPEQQVIYFRKQRPPRLTEKSADGKSESWQVEGDIMEWWMENADGRSQAGKGIGYTSSLGFSSSKEGFVMTVEYDWDHAARWDDSVSSGKLKKTWLFRQLTDTGIPVAAGPFRAKVSVEKI